MYDDDDDDDDDASSILNLNIDIDIDQSIIIIDTYIKLIKTPTTSIIH